MRPLPTEVNLTMIEEIFGEVVDLSGIAFRPEAVLGEDIPVDSKEMLRIVSRIESRYRFRFQPEDLLQLRTLDDLLGIIQRGIARRIQSVKN
jgi:acyl carrier protein